MYEGIGRRAGMNEQALRLTSAYLNQRPRFITAADAQELSESCGVTCEEAVRLLFAAGCGVDEQESAWQSELARTYLYPSVRELEAAAYRADAYYRTIHFGQARMGRWKLTTLRYAPYELFVRDDMRCFADGREMPQLGYFPEEFSYPAVLEDGREWMTVTPNEIETMRPAIARAHGHVTALGLGLGYFAFGASEKENVDAVTVVERDSDVIALFEKHILPQFPHREKIRIVRADAFAWAETWLPDSGADYVFADLWHDVGDGMEMYLRLRRAEHHAPKVEWSYWIEPSLLCWLRMMLLDVWASGDTQIGALLGNAEDEASLRAALSDRNLRRIAAEIPLEWVRL